MRISLLGYGKMGREIEAIASERGHHLPFKINSSNTEDRDSLSAENTDVVIEFSRPESAVENISACLKKGLPIVVGTTGWYEQYEQMKKLCRENNTALLAGTNFSVGVNILFQLNKQLAKMMDKQESYSAEVEEIHHTQKLDSPSGTAITLAEGILENHHAYESWVNEKTDKAKVLPIHSIRTEGVPGTHEISYRSAIDDISIRHVAHNRKGFALGAVLAAEYITGKSGVFTMSDVLDF
jgi:4-hydroxy-tetrahydrodipicolinate reductase